MTDFADRINILSRELSRGAIAAVLGVSEAEIADVRADPDAALPPATPAPAAYVFYYNAAGTDTFVAVPEGEQEMSGFRQRIDLTRASQVRLVVYQGGREGGSFDIEAQCFVPLTELAYSDEGSYGVDFTWGAGPSVTIEGPGDGGAMLVSDWTDLEPGMKADLSWRIVTLDGDDTGTASLRHIDLQVR